ncbi:MAG: hypothetical protein IK071_01515 [Lachnospiraceae bacterium]|nr:hypothetical protein [Lachnospiraceae bacterium]
MKKIVLCLMLIAAITLLAGCGKDNDTQKGNDNSNSNQTVDNKNTDNDINDDNNIVDNETETGSDWRTWRSYTSDFQIKSDLTVCLSRFDDGNGYAVYDSKDGSRIGNLVAELDGNELISCADYDDDGIFELGLGGTPSGDIWFRYVDRPWSEGGCFEEYDFTQGVSVDTGSDDNGNNGADDGDDGDFSDEDEFIRDLVMTENIDYIDVVNTTALGIYMEDTDDRGNSHFFDYEDGEVSFDTMSEFDCAYLTLYTEDYGESALCFLEKNINDVIQWNIEDGYLVVDWEESTFYGSFYYDYQATSGNGLYICLHIDNYNIWLRCYTL